MHINSKAIQIAVASDLTRLHNHKGLESSQQLTQLPTW